MATDPIICCATRALVNWNSATGVDATGGEQMSFEAEFDRLAEGLRRGDAGALTECVRRFEAEIRRAARVQLRDPRLRRMVDSMDITQSVFRRFFVRCQEGAYRLDGPEKLLALLVTMTRNRVMDWARKQRVERLLACGNWLLEDGEDRERQVSTDPRTRVERAELAAEIRSRLLPLEYETFRRRADGDSWEAIGEALGQSSEALRKRLQRGLLRVRIELQAELEEFETHEVPD